MRLVKWFLAAALLAGCGAPLGHSTLPPLPINALTSRLMAGYMPFLWAFADGTIGLAVEQIEGERRSVVLTRSPDGNHWDRPTTLLPDEPFVSHPSAVTLSNGETLMHVLVKRQNRYRIAQVSQPFGRPAATVLSLGSPEGNDLAPFVLRRDRTLYLTWTRQNGAMSQVMISASQDLGRTWAAGQVIANGQISRLAPLEDGTLLVTYQTAQPKQAGLAIQALRYDPRSRHASNPQAVTDAGDCHDAFPLAQRDGTVSVVYIGSTGGPYGLYETETMDGTLWSEPKPLSANGQMNVEPHLLGLPQGGQLMAWGIGQAVDGPYQIHLLRR